MIPAVWDIESIPKSIVQKLCFMSDMNQNLLSYNYGLFKTN